jgi:hypothetical protein
MLKDRKTNVVDLTTRTSELSLCFTFYLFTSGLLNDRHELSAIRFIVIAPNTVDDRHTRLRFGSILVSPKYPLFQQAHTRTD